MKENSKVSIIILNWNGWRDTVECLQSLSKLAYPNYEVVVVDNGSTDDDREQLKSQISKLKSTTQNLKLIFNNKNLGFAEGNNVAIRQVLKEGRSDFILLLNNDTVVDKDFLSELVAAAQRDEKIGIVGPKVYYYDYQGRKDVIQTTGSTLNLFQERRRPPLRFGGDEADTTVRAEGAYKAKQSTTGSARGSLYWGKFPEVGENPDRAGEVDWVSGACLLIKVAAIEDIGLLDKSYFLFFEDIDWCLRAQRAGYSIFYTPRAVIWHKKGRSFEQNNVSQVYYYTRNLFWFEFKHADRRQLLCFLLNYFAFIFPKYFLGYWLVKRDRDLLKSYTRGIRDGILLKN
ncbi:glycosyltransferase family 2 protein [Candidatus Parcubacteria bacterium]|nr:glycosyltransferase family 2 protein [Candidatus Parcubacteria bacterium]